MEYFRSQPGVVLYYVHRAVWPSTLCIDLAWPIAHSVKSILWPAISMLTGAAATIILVGRRHPLAFPAAAFFVLLAPSSSFVPIRDLAAEHRMYLALASLLLLVVSGIWRALRVLPARPAAVVGIALLAVGATALAMRTVARNRDYASPVSLWSATVRAAPHNDRARINLGAALLAADRPEEAARELARALEARPTDPEVRLGYGAALAQAGRFQEAIPVLESAAAALPRRPRASILLGDTLRAAGRPDAAIDAYRRAYTIAPQPSIALALGNALAEAGRLEDAQRMFRETADEATDTELRAAALFNLGNLHFGRGAFQQAIDAYREALDAAPEHAGARHWLAEAERRRDAP